MSTYKCTDPMHWYLGNCTDALKRLQQATASKQAADKEHAEALANFTSFIMPEHEDEDDH